ncbi:PAS domain S-box protein [Magnetospirillum sp. SS-4]|uniref:PAS domain S-box protein n=1 Tax=Magnetospirillum sp. SS-4 TaxID=2681465 RepID=UPI0015720DDC|nr:PAS domain S-box protein [Magnetospirillum sp. SS-4]
MDIRQTPGSSGKRSDPKAVRPAGRVRSAAALAVVCVLALTGWQIWSSRHDSIEEIKTQTSVLSRVAEDHITGMVRGIDLLLGEIADLAHGGNAVDRAAFNTLLNSRMKHMPFIRNAFVTDAAGTVTHSTLAGMPRIEVHDREYFTALKADANLPLYISPPLRSRIQPVMSVFIARPLRGVSGDFLGIAAITVDPRAFEDQLGIIRPASGGTATLLRTEGTVLARVPDPDKWIGRWLGDGEVIRSLSKGPQGVLHGTGRTDGADRVTAYRQLQFYPLVVTVGVRTGAALDRWRSDIWLHGGIGLTLALVLTGLAALSARGQAERQRSQAALAASEERFRRLSDRSPVGVVQAGLDGTCLYANPRWLEIVGRGPEDVLGARWFDLAAAEDRPAVAGAWDTLAQGGEFSAELRVRTPGGALRWVRGRASMLGEVDLVATFEDVTAAKEAERRLRLSEEKFSKAFRGSPDALTISTLAGGAYVDVNRAFCLMLGYDQAELMGRTAHDLGVWADPGDRARLVEIVARDGQAEDFETRLRRKDGSAITVLISAQPIEVGGEPCLLFICRDVSERRAMEARTRTLLARLDASNKELEQFAYVTSHDLQEPLRMIAGYAQLIERRYRGRLDSDADEFIAFLVDGAKRMQGMIQDLLEYSRVERLGGAFVEFDIAGVMEDVRRNLAAALAETGGRIEVGPMPRLTGDRAQIMRLLQNLIGNALKYRHPGRPPEIAVAAARDEGGWTISVSDNGIGIESQYFDRIFLVFQRLHTREKYPGTGIGLAICKKIVERHGGRLWVESRLHHGSVFRFSLPDAPGTAVDTAPE